MKFLPQVSAVLCIVDAVVAVHASTTRRQTDIGDFQSFGQSLGLPDSVISQLATRYANANSSVETAQVACMTAQAALGQYQVESPPHNGTIEENWSETCIQVPACIVRPTNSSGVSTTIRILGSSNTKFAVRGGGHSPNPGWSSVGQDGILLTLDSMNTITLSQDRTYASLGSGARWGSVYAALDRQKALVLGARILTVGVGGSLLGGGYSFLANEFGLAADKVKNYEVVLGNGTIVQANTEENVSLFWALKGGGPNFGVVTRYDIYTVPRYQIWAEVLAFSPEQATQVLTAHDAWQRNGSSDPKSTVFVIVGLDSVLLGLVYSEPANETPSAFASFSNLQPLSIILGPMNTTVSSFAQAVGSSSPDAPPRHDYRGCSTRIDTNLTLEVYKTWREKALAVRNATGANQTFTLQHVGASFNRGQTEAEGNPLNIPPGDQQWWTTLIDWTDEKDDDLVRSVSIETCEQWKTLGKERGSDLPFIYMNDASRDENPLASYGNVSLEKLKNIAKAYDPGLVFQNLQNSGFLLSKA